MDGEVLDAMLDIYVRERTVSAWRDELAAETAELVHALWRVTIAANSKKGAHLPPAWRAARPWQTSNGRRTVTASQLAALMTGQG